MKEEKGKTAFSRIMSNTTVIVIGKVLNAICSFIFIPWTVQTIGLNGFGQLLLITSYLILISDITHLHSWQPLVHYGTLSLKEKKYKKFNQILTFCMRADALSGLTGMIVGLIGISLFSHLMKWPDSIQKLAEFCNLTIMIMNRGWPVGVLRLLNRFKIATTIELIGTLTRTAGTFIGYELQFSLYYFVWLWCFTQFILFIIYNFIAFFLVHQSVKQPFPWKELFFPTIKIPGIWKLTVGTSINEILQAFFKQISTLLIGAWMGASDAAIFRVASQITNAMAKPASMLIPALYPEFIRFRDNKDQEGLRHTLSRIYITIAVFSVLVLTVSLGLGSYILDYMLHHRYPQGGLLISILAMSSLIDIAVVPLEPLLTVMDKVYSVLWGKATAILIYMPVLFGLTYRFGVWGAAEASVLSSAIMFIWCSVSSVRVMACFGLFFPKK